eukprot:SAG31_NODE_10973_length_1077_cov_1.281186_1_plen_168_part_10
MRPKAAAAAAAADPSRSRSRSASRKAGSRNAKQRKAAAGSQQWRKHACAGCLVVGTMLLLVYSRGSVAKPNERKVLTDCRSPRVCPVDTFCFGAVVDVRCQRSFLICNDPSFCDYLPPRGPKTYPTGDSATLEDKKNGESARTHTVRRLASAVTAAPRPHGLCPAART